MINPCVPSIDISSLTNAVMGTSRPSQNRPTLLTSATNFMATHLAPKENWDFFGNFTRDSSNRGFVNQLSANTDSAFGDSLTSSQCQQLIAFLTYKMHHGSPSISDSSTPAINYFSGTTSIPLCLSTISHHVFI